MASKGSNWGLQVALAQAMQQSKSASLEARLAALEARAAAGGTPLQCSPESRRMTRDIAELGCEAVRAEDLNGILGRLVSASPAPMCLHLVSPKQLLLFMLCRTVMSNTTV